MSDYLKITAGVIVALFLSLVQSKQNANFPILISVTVSCIVLSVAGTYLSPVLRFIDDLKNLANVDSEAIEILIKSVGIGLISEITTMICNDAGHASMGKALQIFATVLIIYIGLPLFTSLINLVEEILVII